MALNIRNREAERLAESLARLRSERAGRRLADELDEIGLHCSRLPIRDTRSAEEILGDDEKGVPR